MRNQIVPYGLLSAGRAAEQVCAQNIEAASFQFVDLVESHGGFFEFLLDLDLHSLVVHSVEQKFVVLNVPLVRKVPQLQIHLLARQSDFERYVALLLDLKELVFCNLLELVGRFELENVPQFLFDADLACGAD